MDFGLDSDRTTYIILFWGELFHKTCLCRNVFCSHKLVVRWLVPHIFTPTLCWKNKHPKSTVLLLLFPLWEYGEIGWCTMCCMQNNILQHGPTFSFFAPSNLNDCFHMFTVSLRWFLEDFKQNMLSLSFINGFPFTTIPKRPFNFWSTQPLGELTDFST